jgi:hypothetical protein
MLLLSCLVFSILATAFSGDVIPNSLSPRQLPNAPCVTNCSIPLATYFACAADPDPWCGCNEFTAGSHQCSDCLSNTNTTLAEFFNPLFVQLIVSVCKCQNVTDCGNLVLGLRSCGPSNATCGCPVILEYQPNCAPCWIANGANATELNLQLESCKMRASSSVPGTGTATAGNPPPTTSASKSGSAMIYTVPYSAYMGFVIVFVIAMANVF